MEEASLLRRVLQGFCYEFHWDYAVFWKLHSEQMLLKWEEGYCYNPTLRGSIESEPVDREFNIDDPIFSFNRKSSQPDGYPYEFPAGVSLDDMRSVKYHLGEGVVGKLVSTGNYSWILSEKLLVCDFESNMVPECPDEWLLQFATGIKTIVLIPVALRGVLQLGSSRKVSEDPTLVALVRNKFNVYLNTVDMVPTSSLECGTKISSSPIYTDNLGGFSSSMVSQMEPEYLKTVFSVYNNASTTNQMMPLHFVEDVCYFSKEIRVENDNISCQFGGLDGMFPLDHDIRGEMSEITKIGSSTEDIKSLSCSGYNFGIFGQDKNIEAKFVEHFVDEETKSSTDINSLFSFSMDCELHKALGSTFQMQSNNTPWNQSVASEDSQSRSSMLLNRNLNQGNAFLLNRDDDEEHQLDTVYATPDSYINYDIFKEPNVAKSSVESSDRLSVSVIVDGPKNFASQEPCPSLTENSLSTLVHEEKKKKKGYMHSQIKGSKVCRKRAGPGEKPKPRPRDRQLIQDRVKELRELIPNASKCSIDGLLDSTIKHLMFLRGISERAGKLRHWVNQEVTGYKKMRLSSPEHDSNKGTSWAYEIGGDFQVCPIVVKDLEHPGHMLIEMLCNDNGLFLEVAEVIRRLDLTILKGLMESRPDNTWAHFIVEVSKGFQRLDIFWPLMQVLQKNRTPVSG